MPQNILYFSQEGHHAPIACVVRTGRHKDARDRAKARLGWMAARCRLEQKGTDQYIAELRAIRDRIVADKVVERVPEILTFTVCWRRGDTGTV